ncbi:MAG: DoxX family protein [Pseudomonadota bacterium]
MSAMQARDAPEQICSDGCWALRAPLAALFAFSALTKLFDLQAGFGEMAHFGLPALVLFPLIAFQFGSAVALVAGLWLRPVSLALAAFVLIASIMAHNPITASEFDVRQATVFLEHGVIIGALVWLAGRPAS